MNDLLAGIGAILLPLGIAVAGTVTTVRVAGMQIRARQYERDQDRLEREAERSRHADATVTEVRAQVIEGIVEAFALFAETSPVAGSGSGRAFRVKSALMKLSTRCHTEHLSTACVAYVSDSLRSPHPEHVIGTFSDIQRRLEGWHMGHLSLHAVGELIDDGRRQTREHLESHQISPVGHP